MLRIQFEGALYHIISRGNQRKMIFLQDADRARYLKYLDATIQRFNWICHAYCVMGNHYHLMLETPDANLAKGMKYLNQIYSQYFNWKYNRVGHVFQGRYKSYVVQREAYLLDSCRYIVLNPWEAKLVEHPGQWPWSSYNATAGTIKPPPFLTTEWVLKMFGTKEKKAKEQYVRFVEADMDEKRTKLEYNYQIFLGSDEFAEKILQRYGPFSSMTDINNTQMGFGRPSLEELFHGTLTSKETRNKMILTAYRKYRYPLKQIAKYHNMNPNYLCEIIRKTET